MLASSKKNFLNPISFIHTLLTDCTQPIMYSVHVACFVSFFTAGTHDFDINVFDHKFYLFFITFLIPHLMPENKTRPIFRIRHSDNGIPFSTSEMGLFTLSMYFPTHITICIIYKRNGHKEGIQERHAREKQEVRIHAFSFGNRHIAV